jgi:hypothetical protein
VSYTRKTVTQPWQLRLVFRGGHEEEIALPASMSARSVWKHVRELYPERPGIRVIARGRKQLKVAKC